MKIYVTIDATLEFDTSKAIVDDEFVEQAVEKVCYFGGSRLGRIFEKKSQS